MSPYDIDELIEIVLNKHLKSNLIIYKIVTRKYYPVQCIFALIHLLLCHAILVIEFNDITGFLKRISNDESYPLKGFS